MSKRASQIILLKKTHTRGWGKCQKKENTRGDKITSGRIDQSSSLFYQIFGGRLKTRSKQETIMAQCRISSEAKLLVIATKRKSKLCFSMLILLVVTTFLNTSHLCCAFATVVDTAAFIAQAKRQQRHSLFPPNSSPSRIVTYHAKSGYRRLPVLFSATLPDISTLKIGEMRKELESYGISTKSFLEKKEFVEALAKARAEGKTPITADSSTTSGTSSSSSAKSSGGSSSSLSREERIASEMEKCQSMKVGELKKELEALGISTKSFFEKSEFVKRLATARVDGVEQKQQSQQKQQQQQDYDPAYKDVKMQKFNGDPSLLSGTVIDVRIKP